MVDTRKFFQDFYNQRPTNASQMTILTMYNVLTKPFDKVQSAWDKSISLYVLSISIIQRNSKTEDLQETLVWEKKRPPRLFQSHFTFWTIEFFLLFLGAKHGLIDSDNKDDFKQDASWVSLVSPDNHWWWGNTNFVYLFIIDTKNKHPIPPTEQHLIDTITRPNIMRYTGNSN